jgi:hypothetical protein
MKRLGWMGGVFSAVAVLFAAIPADAAADAWTDEFRIDGIDNGDDGAFTTLAVSSASGNFANPHGCASTGFAIMLGSLSSTAKDLNNRLLLAAFLAGKPVRLRLSGTQCMNAGAVTTGTSGSVAFSLVNVKE